MFETYQTFRKQLLEKLKVEHPELNYRHKLKIISDLWKKEQSKNNRTLTPEMMIEMVRTKPPTTQTSNLLKFGIYSLDADAVNHTIIEGEWFVFGLLTEMFKYDYPDSLCIHIIQKILFSSKVYECKTIEGLNIGELCVKYYKAATLLFIIEKAPQTWLIDNVYQTKDKSFLSCMLHLLCENLKSSELKEKTLKLLSQCISRGVDPNTELFHPLGQVSLHNFYEGDPVYDYIINNAIPPSRARKLVRYTGIVDGGFDFRLRANVKPRNVGYSNFVGETLFSMMYSHGEIYENSVFCSALINTNKIDMRTILCTGSVITSYLRMFIDYDFRNRVEDGFKAFYNSPTYMFYIHSSGYPIDELFDKIKTYWSGFMMTRETLQPVILDIFERSLVCPTENIVKKFLTNTTFMDRLKSIWEESQGNGLEDILKREGRHFLDTGLAHLVVHPLALDKLFGITFRDDYNWKTSFTADELRSLANNIKALEWSRYLEPPHRDLEIKNECFLHNSDPVSESWGRVPVFVSEDGYVFSIEEIDFLMKKMENPFNRRRFSDKDENSLYSLLGHRNRLWFLIDNLVVFETISKNVAPTTDLLVELIDEFIDKCPFFIYGGIRLRTVHQNLNNMEKMHLIYVILMSGPNTIIPQTEDILRELCVPFQTKNDCIPTELINTHYGMEILMELKGEDVRRVKQSLLVWILQNLEETYMNDMMEKFNGRVGSLVAVMEFIMKLVDQ